MREYLALVAIIATTMVMAKIERESGTPENEWRRIMYKYIFISVVQDEEREQGKEGSILYIYSIAMAAYQRNIFPGLSTLGAHKLGKDVFRRGPWVCCRFHRERDTEHGKGLTELFISTRIFACHR